MSEGSERCGVKELMQTQVWQNLLKALLINYLTLCCSEESVLISWHSLLLHDDPWSVHLGTSQVMQSRQSHCQDALLFISVLSSLKIKYSSLKAAHKYKQTSLQTSATKVAIRRYHLILESLCGCNFKSMHRRHFSSDQSPHVNLRLHFLQYRFCQSPTWT